MNVFRDHAMAYREWGWAIFPVGRNKHPLESLDELGLEPGQGGVKRATTCGDQIDVWRERFPDGNIAVACGRVSGITVIDIDGPEGENNAAWLSRHFGSFPATVEAKSGNGRHLYYRYEPAVKNWSGKPGPKIDIRTGGGSVTAPPSIHKSGRAYAWVNSPADTPLAPFPLWIVHKIARDEQAKRLRDMPKRGAPPRALEDWLAEITRAAPGERNHTLNRIAFIVGARTAESRGDPQHAMDALISAAAKSGLPLVEARGTAKSGFRAGYRS